jgi:hypothetical protein
MTIFYKAMIMQQICSHSSSQMSLKTISLLEQCFKTNTQPSLPAFQTEGHLQNQPSYMIESNQPVYKTEDHNQKYFHGDHELGQTMHFVDSSTMYAQHADGKLSMAASNEHQFKRELLDRQINQQHEVNYHAYFT